MDIPLRQCSWNTVRKNGPKTLSFLHKCFCKLNWPLIGMFFEWLNFRGGFHIYVVSGVKIYWLFHYLDVQIYTYFRLHSWTGYDRSINDFSSAYTNRYKTADDLAMKSGRRHRETFFKVLFKSRARLNCPKNNNTLTGSALSNFHCFIIVSMCFASINVRVAVFPL